MASRTIRADLVESQSSSANPSEMTIHSARRSSLKPAKGTGHAHLATTATSLGAQSANAAILERTAHPARLHNSKVAKGIGSARVVATTILHSELNANVALHPRATLKEHQQVVVDAVDSVEVEAVEIEVVVAVGVVEDSAAVIEVDVDGEDLAAVIEADVDVEDSINRSGASRAKQTRQATRKSSSTNKLKRSKECKKTWIVEPLAELYVLQNFYQKSFKK